MQCEPQQKLRIFYQVQHTTAFGNSVLSLQLRTTVSLLFAGSSGFVNATVTHDCILTKTTCSCAVLVQQQHTAADGGQRRSPLSLVHSELQQTLQPAQAPQTLSFTLHLQLCGQSARVEIQSHTTSESSDLSVQKPSGSRFDSSSAASP